MFFPISFANYRLRRRSHRCARGAGGAHIIAAAFVLALSATPAAAAGLTLAEAQRLALERSMLLTAQDSAAQAAREMAVAAGQLADPVVRIGVDNLPISGGDRFSLTRDFMTMTRVGVTQELVPADKRRVRATRFEREADKAVAQKAAFAAIAERDTAIAWLERHYAEAIATVVEEIGAQARLEIQAAEGAYRAGRGSQADVYVAQSALASFEDRASEARRKVRNAEVSLARWIGDAAERPLDGEPQLDRIRLDPATLDRDLAHHPQIAVFTQQIEVAAAEASVAQANRKSDWSVELAYQQRGPSYSNMVSIGVSIPWQWDRVNRQDRELAAKLAAVEQLRSERDEMLRAHVAETRAMINEWENGRERLARYRRDLIPLAGSRTEAAIAAYRGGKSPLTDVLGARRNEIDVRIQALQIEADIARLWAQISFLYPTTATPTHPGDSSGGRTQ